MDQFHGRVSQQDALATACLRRVNSASPLEAAGEMMPEVRDDDQAEEQEDEQKALSHGFTQWYK